MRLYEVLDSPRPLIDPGPTKSSTWTPSPTVLSVPLATSAPSSRRPPGLLSSTTFPPLASRHAVRNSRASTPPTAVLRQWPSRQGCGTCPTRTSYVGRTATMWGTLAASSARTHTRAILIRTTSAVRIDCPTLFRRSARPTRWGRIIWGL